MKPSRQLDALIAKKVMGWKIVECNGVLICTAKEFKGHVLPPFSEDISASCMIVDKLSKYSFELHRQERYKEPWTAIFWDDKGNKIFNKARTAPHAICLAALKAVGHDHTPTSPISSG